MSALHLTLKLATRLLEAAVALVAGLYLLLLLGLLALRYLLLPNLDQLQPWLERSASQAVGLPVHIGAVQGRWAGLLPDITLRDLEIDDAAGHPALKLASVQALPSWKSLLRWQPSFEQLVVDGAQLDLARPDATHLQLGGLLFDLSAPSGTGARRLADWLFAQDQILLRDASIRWSDASRGAPALKLDAVNLELRNTTHRHRIALRALAPSSLGGNIELRGDFSQSWLSRHPGDFTAWHGQVWAAVQQVDLQQVARYLPLPPQLQGGQGRLQAWLNLGPQLQPVGLTVAGALRDSRWQLQPQQAVLALPSLSGSIGVMRLDQGWRLQLGHVQLSTADHLSLAPLSLDLSWQQPSGQGSRGRFASSPFDLQQLTELARRLPLPSAWQQRLQTWQPHGRVDALSASWEQAAPTALPQHYQIDARFSGLGWARPPAGLPAAIPGVENLSGRVQADQNGGGASLRVQDGWLSMPSLFEAPKWPLQQLEADLNWSRDSKGLWTVRSQRLQLANADAAGSASLSYTSAAHGPGAIDLTGQLTRADARAVPRYLPLSIPAATRDYLRSAIAGGHSDDVRFTVRGPLADFPFGRSHSGQFHIAARIADGVFSIAPHRLLPAGQQETVLHAPGNADWPLFSAIDGLLEFDGAGMHVHGASARVFSSAVTGVNLDLPDFGHPVLAASGKAQVDAGDALHYLRASPLDGWLGHALSDASGSGSVGLDLQLKLPLNDIGHSQVRGQLQLRNPQLRLWPQLPAFNGVGGRVDFTDTSFQMKLAAQDFLGGPLQLSGGRSAGNQPLQLSASGLLRAAALPAQVQLADWKPLLQRLHGQARFTTNVLLPAGAEFPSVSVRSNLQGLQIALPAPLGKDAAAALPLSATLSDAGAQREIWQLALGGALRSQLLLARANGSLLAGQVALGAGPDPARPAHGLQLSIQLPELDLDAWQAALGGAGAGGAALPDTLLLRTGQLRADGYRLDALTLDANRNGRLWQAQVQSHQLGGKLSWLTGEGDDPGAIVARLSHLSLPRDSASDKPVDATGTVQQNARQLPALDVIADDVDLRGLHANRVELKARNRQQDWELSSFKITLPQARLSGSGDWSGPAGHRRMAIGFKLAVDDAGALLQQLGKPGLIKGGSGQLTGSVSWPGSALAPNFSAMSGALNLALAKGQFLKADPGLAKLLGVLSLQSLPRRLLFNFSDVFESGFVFDDMGADVSMQEGIASTHNFRMRGVSAAVFIDGSADIAKETQDLDVVVVPEINAGSASLAYSLINPAVGLGSFLAQLVARKPLIEAFTYGYHVSGSWAHPKVLQTRGKPPQPGASAPAAHAAPASGAAAPAAVH